ncbi:MAG: ribosome recycling factor [Chitinivibrionales bacterium]|nr:ribosome recycling factor [Chitinivibrionales bacterium]MBD3394524.1 ribosome recycling factor [Chitinivibrionales bacterium]
MADLNTVYQETTERMQKTVDALKREFARIRTGRASPSLLDGITVDYYGSPMPINQVGTISIPDARLLTIQPWEKTMLGPIEKAIQAADLGLNPQNDGNLIRVPIPPLSEERRKELYKGCKKTSEDSKVAVRNIRRDSNEKLKKAEKDKEMTQDEQKKGMDRIQKLTDEFVNSIDELLAHKEKEIMEV